jgi:DNA-directed RNA polymerase subunit beta
VKTGIEKRGALDSGAAVTSDVDGVVVDVTAKGIAVRSYDGEEFYHPLRTFVRSNQATCIHQKPIVAKGERVTVGQAIADGPATKNGELRLGRNMTVAFSLWEGYNYEDAIILSERVSKEDALTSVHIEKYEVEARDTKLGPEEITRDIPNIGEDQLKNLDEHGIIRVGAEVLPQDILVGKIAPKSQGELSAEERLVSQSLVRKPKNRAMPACVCRTVKKVLSLTCKSSRATNTSRISIMRSCAAMVWAKTAHAAKHLLVRKRPGTSGVSGHGRPA